MYSKILVPLDGSSTSEAVIPQVVKALGSGSVVTLLTVEEIPYSLALNVGPRVVAGAPAPGGVVTLPAPKVPETRGQAISRITDERSQYLEGIAEPLYRAGLKVRTKVAFGGDAGDQILKVAQELDVDAIFMATHGHTALGQIVFGSVAEKVMQAGIRPVLMVRPEKLNEHKGG
jgi:nucleotide-binding universal stress UspA family protein